MSAAMPTSSGGTGSMPAWLSFSSICRRLRRADNADFPARTVRQLLRIAGVSLPVNELANGRAGPERLLWCDLARAIAAALVVLIHVAAKWFENYGHISAFDWQIANILDSAARLSVPWFFMLRDRKST